jgi:tripartite-type tricarboxylate transporter receptor subunit TctC
MEVAMKRFVALAALAWACSVLAQPYPTKPVTIVNGFPPGGVTDGVLRTLAARLGERLGQPVVVENRPGAAGMIAASGVARAVPDGYTLLFGVAANLAVGPASIRKPPYDPLTAFTPVVEISRGPYLWLVRADHPAVDMRAFVDWAKSSQGKANYASPGQGSVHHLATEMLKHRTGMPLTHVPYKGGSALAAALLSGEVDGMFESPATYIGQIRGGKMRALAVTGARRLPALPEVPTLREQNLPELEVNSWWGLVGPAGLAPEIVRRLNVEVTRALAEADLKAALDKMSVEASAGSPEAFAAYMREEFLRWKQFVATSGILLD